MRAMAWTLESLGNWRNWQGDANADGDYDDATAPVERGVLPKEVLGGLAVMPAAVRGEAISPGNRALECRARTGAETL
jgi:hypothetical protein